MIDSQIENAHLNQRDYQYKKKSVKADGHGKNTEFSAHNSMAGTKILDASTIPEHPWVELRRDKLWNS